MTAVNGPPRGIPPPTPPALFQSMMPALRRHITTLLKLTVAAAILGLLAYQAQRHEAFSQLVEGEKNWFLLVLGLLAAVLAAMMSFARWRVVAQAAGLDMSYTEALRYGALGFALNFIGPGSVSGDVAKAIALSRNRKGQRVAATTTVVVDRFLGLFAMLLVASVAILLFTAFGSAPSGAAWLVCLSTLGVTCGAVLACFVLFVPGLAGEKVVRRVSAIPLIGGVASQLLRAWRDYQQRPATLVAAIGVSFLVDAMLVTSYYLVAIGLPFQVPTFIEHFFIVPINLISASIPITPFGLGLREGVSDLLYQGFGVPPGQGTLIAAGHTLTMLAAGGVAVVYYLIERGRGDALVVEVEGATTPNKLQPDDSQGVRPLSSCAEQA